MKRLFIACLLGCVSMGQAFAGEVEDIIEGATTTDSAAAACLRARDIKQVEIINNEMVVLHGKFDKFWLSRLSNKCSGLRKDMVVSLSLYGSKMCANDRFEAHDRGGLSSGGFRTSCRFGEFESLAEEQISSLKKTVEDA